MSVTTWTLVGAVPPGELRDPRVELHWAAQIPAAVGEALVASTADDSHTSLEAVRVGDRWLLAGLPTETPTPVRVALDLAKLDIVLLESGTAVRTLSLLGQRLDESLAAVARAVADVSGAPAPRLALRDYDMPAHPVAGSGRFRNAAGDGFVELSRWFANASGKLGELGGSARLWPHHFDIALLEPMDAERSVNTGLSPGDEHYEEPYFYVSPWPYPEGVTPEPLASGKGHWHQEGFLAAVLTGTDVVRAGSASEQEATVDDFLVEARAAARGLAMGGEAT